MFSVPDLAARPYHPGLSAIFSRMLSQPAPSFSRARYFAGLCFYESVTRIIGRQVRFEWLLNKPLPVSDKSRKPIRTQFLNFS